MVPPSFLSGRRPAPRPLLRQHNMVLAHRVQRDVLQQPVNDKFTKDQ
jgi:hypothetical protein